MGFVFFRRDPESVGDVCGVRVPSGVLQLVLQLNRSRVDQLRKSSI